MEPVDRDAASRGASPPPRSLIWPRLALLSAILAALSAGASLAPIEWPAWPAVSLGVLALLASTRPGPAMTRAISAFLGLVALLVGALQIAALYGAAAAL